MRKAGFVTAAIFLPRRMRDGSTFWLTAVDEWEKALYWRDVADQAIAIPPEGVNVLNSKISAYQFRIDQLKIGYEQAKEQVRRQMGLG